MNSNQKGVCCHVNHMIVSVPRISYCKSIIDNNKAKARCKNFHSSIKLLLQLSMVWLKNKANGSICFVLTCLPHLYAFLNERIFDSRLNCNKCTIIIINIADNIYRGSHISCCWFLCGSSILIELQFGKCSVVIQEGGKLEDSVKNPRNKVGTNKYFKPHMVPGWNGTQQWPTFVGDKHSHQCAICECVLVSDVMNWAVMCFFASLFNSGEGGLLIHCISGWDRTPLFISLLRMSLWAVRPFKLNHCSFFTCRQKM